jgi:hypothetical protein
MLFDLNGKTIWENVKNAIRVAFEYFGSRAQHPDVMCYILPAENRHFQLLAFKLSGVFFHPIWPPTPVLWHS